MIMYNSTYALGKTRTISRVQEATWLEDRLYQSEDREGN